MWDEAGWRFDGSVNSSSEYVTIGEVEGVSSSGGGLLFKGGEVLLEGGGLLLEGVGALSGRETSSGPPSGALLGGDEVGVCCAMENVGEGVETEDEDDEEDEDVDVDVWGRLDVLVLEIGRLVVEAAVILVDDEDEEVITAAAGILN